MEAIIKKVKDACEKRGTINLQRTFKVFDDDRRASDRDHEGNRKLSLAEFQKGLSDYNTGVTQEEAKQLFDHLDKNKSGDLDIDEFLNILREPLSAKCMDVVMKAFNKLDTTNDGVIKSEDVRKYYNAPEGTSFDEYLATFDSGDSGSGPVVVTKEEFIEYYTYQRATMYPSDDYMIAMVERAWGL